jgi:diguanylate cyclase
VALAASLGALPLLGGIWILLFGRTWMEARRRRDATIRLALASDLGLTPHELTSLSTRALFKLREQAAFDELTGVLRRAAGIAAVDREVARARRQGEPLSVAFIDLDGLKASNHRGGHSAGDRLLRDLSETLRDGLRGQDLVFRYGGDEFVCLLPDTSEDDGRTKLAQIHQVAAARGIEFCFGVAELRSSDDVVSLLGRADGDLYDRKAHRELANLLELLPV